MLWEEVLPVAAVAAVLDYAPAGCVDGRQLCILALARGYESPADLRYLELAPDGATWLTALIDSAGEPGTAIPSLDVLDGRRVLNFVIFTSRGGDEPGWASMREVVSALRERLHGVAEVLDCEARQCEILPISVNKACGCGDYSPNSACGVRTRLRRGEHRRDAQSCRRGSCRGQSQARGARSR